VNLSCRGPALLAHHFGSRLRARGRGGLLLMSSMASVPGAANQAAARGISPTPRVAIINGMSQAGAALFDLEHTPVAGIEYHEA